MIFDERERVFCEPFHQAESMTTPSVVRVMTPSATYKCAYSNLNASPVFTDNTFGLRSCQVLQVL